MIFTFSQLFKAMQFKHASETEHCIVCTKKQKKSYPTTTLAVLLSHRKIQETPSPSGS